MAAQDDLKAKAPLALEAVAYVSALFILPSIAAYVLDGWNDYPSGRQFAIVGVLTLGALGGALRLRRDRRGPAQRLLSVLAVGAAVGSIWLVGIAVAATTWPATFKGVMIAVVAVVVTGALYGIRRRALPQLALLTVLAALAAAAFGHPSLVGGVMWSAIAVWAVGVSWAVLGFGGLLKPRSVAMSAGACVALLGAGVAATGDGGAYLRWLAIGTAAALALWVVVALIRRAERSAAAPRAPKPSRWYVVGAALPLTVVAALALAVGIVRVPALEILTLAERAALPGGIAWTESDNVSGCTSLMVAWPNGEVESIACEEGMGNVVWWGDDGIVTYRQWGETTTYDPVTGEVLARRDARLCDSACYFPTSNGFIDERTDDGTLVIASIDGAVAWRTEADARYEVGVIAVSPDGQWLAFTDSAHRLLVVRTSGSMPPALWVTGFDSWSDDVDATWWQDLVWEGTEPPDWY